MRADLKRLSRYAVLFRYPGESADRPEALQAVQAMRRCRQDLRVALGLQISEGVRNRPRGKKKKR